MDYFNNDFDPKEDQTSLEEIGYVVGWLLGGLVAIGFLASFIVFIIYYFNIGG